MAASVKVYGSRGSPETARTLAHLDALRVNYEYRDVSELNRAAGQRSPVIIVEDTADDCRPPAVLTAPGDSELDVTLDRYRALPLSAGGDGSVGV